MVSRIATLLLSLAPAVCIASAAKAEPASHPRVAEVNHRVAAQQHRIAEAVDHGRISRWQAARDERREERIERQVRRDEERHDGHITLAEQRRLNRELDRNSIHIEDQRLDDRRRFDDAHRVDMQVNRP